jgi:hypothetical protein
MVKLKSPEAKHGLLGSVFQFSMFPVFTRADFRESFLDMVSFERNSIHS